MKNIIFISFILFAFVVKGQEEFYNTPWKMQSGLQKITELKNINPGTIEITKTTTNYSIKGKVVSKNKSIYAINNGKTSGVTLYSKKGKVDKHYQAYYQDSLINRIDLLNKKGKNKRTFSINSPNKNYYNLLYFAESHHGKLKSSIRSDYQKNGKKTLLVSKTVCKGKKEKPVAIWRYEYNEDLSLKTTTQFNRKGEIKHIWSHDCKPEGEDLMSSKDTTIVCKNTSVNENGDIVTVIISSDAKNKITKKIFVYDSKEQLKSLQIFNNNDILTYECNITQSNTGGNKILSSKSYNHKGELLYTSTSEYTKDNLMVSSEFVNKMKKENYTSRTEYEYHDDLSLKCIKTYNENIIRSKTEYEYKYSSEPK